MTGEEDASPGEAIATAQALTLSLDRMAKQLKAQGRYGHRNRKMIWALAFCVVALLTAGIVINSVRSSNASDLAKQVHATQVNTCQQANQTRLKTLQIWDYVLAVPPSTPPDAQQKKIRADFKTFVHQVFAPRDCSHL